MKSQTDSGEIYFCIFYFISLFFLFVKDKIGVQERDTEKFAGALRALGLWSRREAGSAGA